MASIGEVARRAGVSITTVSRVLNPVSEYPVAAATRRRVLAAAAALQYSPSALARALVTRRSRMVGVLLGDIADPYFAEIVRGIEDVARRSGYLVVVCNTSRDPGTERRYVTALRDYRADAIIFLGGDIFDAPTRRALERELLSLTSYGAVALAVAGDHADLPAIDIDHTAGAEEMVRYLIGLGHVRIGYISGPPTVSTARYRHQGGVEAMQAVIDALQLEKPHIYPRRLPFHLVIRESSGPPLLARIGKPTRRRARSSIGAGRQGVNPPDGGHVTAAQLVDSAS